MSSPVEPRRISRRAVLGATAGVGAVGAAGVAVGLLQHRLPGWRRFGELVGLGGPATPYPSGPAGEVHEESFTSQFRTGPEKWAWAAPADTDPKGLPVVIVLHGSGDDHRAAFDQLAAHVYAQELVSQGATPFVVASLDGESAYWHPRADGQSWARLVSDGLMSELDALGCDTSRVALMGWSMGGMGALRLAGSELKGRVKAVAAMSPAVFGDWPSAPQGAFDSEDDYNTNSVQAKIPDLAGLPIHIACGVNDYFINASKRLAEQLDPAPQTMWRRGNHDFDSWRRFAPVQLRFLADHL